VNTTGPFTAVPGVGTPIGVERDKAGTVTSTWFQTADGVKYSIPGDSQISAGTQLATGEWEYPLASSKPGFIDSPTPGDIITPDLTGSGVAYDNTARAWFPSSQQHYGYDQNKGDYQIGGATPAQMATAAAASAATGKWAPVPTFTSPSDFGGDIAAGVSPSENIPVDAVSSALGSATGQTPGQALTSLGFTLAANADGQEVWLGPLSSHAGFTPVPHA
jgi:hypothetical protein